MASTFTPLGVELQATGENAGTWGTKTNTNLQILEQISGGFIQKSIAGSAQTTALAVTDGNTGAELAHRMIEFTGTITGNQIVTIPNDVQNLYFLKNSTSGSYTVQFKYATGSGDSFTFGATAKTTKIVFASGNPDTTNPKIIEISTGSDVVDDTSPQLGGNLDVNGNKIVSTSNGNIEIEPDGTGDVILDTDQVVIGGGSEVGQISSNGAFDLKLVTNSGTDSSYINIVDAANGNTQLYPNGTGLTEIGGGTNPGTIQLNCEANTHGIKLQSPAHSAGQSYTLKFPTGNVTADRYLRVATVSGTGATGIGQLDFAEISGGGTSWQAVKTSDFSAAAGEGYFVDTSSGAVTATLPASPSIGDTFEFKDYAQNFNTNNLSIDPNGNKFEGLNDVTHKCQQNRQSVTVTFSDSTKGYVLTASANSTASENSGLFNIVAPPYTASFVVVAGGGGGNGGFGAGGGGAGGYRSSYASEASGGGGSAETALSLTPGSVYTVTVGAGGNTGKGSDSSVSGSGITTVTSVGGGKGGASDGTENGGSGGGDAGGTGDGSGGTGTANQGFAGGNGQQGGGYQSGGGGGGASQVGGNTTGAGGNPGNGGNGVASTITGSSVTRAGGGGGGQQNFSPGASSSSGGTGGGGGGTKTGSGNAGTANTGGGGGGAEHGGAAGGSGVVILRVATANYSGTTSGSPGVATSGSDTVLTFTGSGSYTA